MSWKDEFGAQYAVPRWFEDHLQDDSWHNDVSPRFSLGAQNLQRGDRHIVVWVDHPNATEREYPDSPRYRAEIWSVSADGYPDADSDIDALESDDLAEVAAWVRSWARDLGLRASPLPREDLGPDVAKALAQIQAHRSRLHMPPLDVQASGWTSRDILDEAARIGHLSNPDRDLKHRLL